MKTSIIPDFHDILDLNFDSKESHNGVTKNLPMKDYRSRVGISSSDIKIANEELGDYNDRGHLYKLARKKIAQHCEGNQLEAPPGILPRQKRKCFDFGSLYHKMLLEPDHVTDEFIVLNEETKSEIIAKRKERKLQSPDYPTDFNPRWKQSVSAKKELGRNLNDSEKKRILEERQTDYIGQLGEFNEHVPEFTEWVDQIRREGKTLVSQSEIDHARAMVNSLYHLNENSEVGEMFTQLHGKHGTIEASLFLDLEYVDDLPSIQLKGRPDLLVDDLILDPKTCLCAHPTIFSRQVERYHYDISMAMYVWLTEMLAGHPSTTGLGFPKKRVGFLAQEKQPPYLGRIYWIPQEWLMYKKEEVQTALSRMARTWGLGEWSQDLMREQEQELSPSRFLQYQIGLLE